MYFELPKYAITANLFYSEEVNTFDKSDDETLNTSYIKDIKTTRHMSLTLQLFMKMPREFNYQLTI
ncbi:hypothetical protein [Clostridium tagluense]|uniref:hypothetical protein n=1 Tax=Clostridium tagluense TaxID=360422 RepID=UPI001C0C1BB7|nr:hypothetical protein [Clostridium tagluense]MBU3130757.1 hypothetical protein [Clostridium tagluense]